MAAQAGEDTEEGRRGGGDCSCCFASLSWPPGNWEQAHNKHAIPEFVWSRQIRFTVLSSLLFIFMSGPSTQ